MIFKGGPDGACPDPFLPTPTPPENLIGSPCCLTLELLPYYRKKKTNKLFSTSCSANLSNNNIAK